MRFEDLMKEGKVRKGRPDVSLAKSLVAMSDRQLSFVSGTRLNTDNASPALVSYYEALREICEAICAKEGYKVYSHEAFTLYLKDNLKEDLLAEKFDRLRRLRNQINYYGEPVSLQEAEAAAAQVIGLIASLKRKYLGEIMK